MANQEHLKVLMQGVPAWNQWRYIHIIGQSTSDKPNSIKATPLIKIDLSGANFSYASLGGANLIGVDLSSADLSNANFNNATLLGANLSEVNLSNAILWGTDLTGTNLAGANLNNAIVSYTIFGDIDLSVVKALETVRHLGPSTIGIDTVYRSQGRIPEVFLKGAGVDDTFIEYIHALVARPIEYYSCFISYSHQDKSFAERLHADLRSKNVRCWFAPHDMKIGDEIRPRIDESIRVHDKLLLVLSSSSLESSWVKKEVETAFEEEERQKKFMLFPISLDDSVMHTSQAWAADIRRTRHIGDFTHWKDYDEYTKALDRLLRDLKQESKRTEH